MSEAQTFSTEVEDKAQEQLAAIKKGTAEIIPEENLLLQLKNSINSKKPLKIKFGADPSRPDLHLGHTVPIEKLKTFQELGHKVLFLIGDFTAQIGDPTGKNETRPSLTTEEVKVNSQTYADQVFKILTPRLTQIVFNSQWTDDLKIKDVINLCSQMTVARMLERDDFSKRYKSGQSICIHEFLYPLMQAYDSVQLNADVEIGGTDQKFNLLLGRDLQRYFKQKPQSVVMLPLLEGTDGIQKMSKSLGNDIGITESSKDIFGKVMSLSDQLMYKYYQLLTNEDLEKVKAMHPRDAKINIAQTLVQRFYDSEIAAKEVENFKNQFSQKKVPDDIPVVKINNNIALLDLILEHKLVASKSEARRLVKQGGVQLSGQKVIDENLVISPNKAEQILKVGKRRFLKLV